MKWLLQDEKMRAGAISGSLFLYGLYCIVYYLLGYRESSGQGLMALILGGTLWVGFASTYRDEAIKAAREKQGDRDEIDWYAAYRWALLDNMDTVTRERAIEKAELHVDVRQVEARAFNLASRYVPSREKRERDERV